MNALISIIIPVYNVEKYLERCLKSVVQQSYYNLEIILINDGSTDKSAVICDSYELVDERIKVIHKGNGGLSDARNAGLAIAKGNYISFLDSDDWIHKDYILELYKIASENKSDISVCNFKEVYLEDKISVEDTFSNANISVFSNLEALSQLTNELYVQFTIACAKLYKKELFDGIEFPFSKLHEDEYTTYKVIAKANKVVYTSKQLYFYYKRPDSIMGQGINLKGRLDYFEALSNQIKFFRKTNLLDNADILCEKLFSTYRVIYIFFLSKNKNSNFIDDKLLKRTLKKHLNESNISKKKKFLCYLFLSNPTIIYSIEKIVRKQYK